MSNIFASSNYRKFLNDTLSGSSVRGIRAQLAEQCSIHPAYITHVLKGRADLNMEQAMRVSQFLKLGGLETKYFINLVGWERAATTELKAYYNEELKSLRQEQQDLKKRLQVTKSLPKEVQAIYYSRWHMIAIHIALAVPELRTPQALQKTFRLPLETVQEALDFLTSSGFAKKSRDQYLPDRAPLHLEVNSPFILKHHMNWRMKAMDKMEAKQSQSLHYSSVISINKSDAPAIREIFIEAIQKIRVIIKASEPESDVYCYAMDFFQINETGN